MRACTDPDAGDWISENSRTATDGLRRDNCLSARNFRGGLPRGGTSTARGRRHSLSSLAPQYGRPVQGIGQLGTSTRRRSEEACPNQGRIPRRRQRDRPQSMTKRTAAGRQESRYGKVPLESPPRKKGAKRSAARSLAEWCGSRDLLRLSVRAWGLATWRAFSFSMNESRRRPR